MYNIQHVELKGQKEVTTLFLLKNTYLFFFLWGCGWGREARTNNYSGSCFNPCIFPIYIEQRFNDSTKSFCVKNLKNGRIIWRFVLYKYLLNTLDAACLL